MERSSQKMSLRRALAGVALVAALPVVPAGCFFPEFTFENDGGGGTTSSPVGGGGTMMTTTSTSAPMTTTGDGGTGGATTTSMMMTTTTAEGGTGGTGGTGGGGAGGGGMGGSMMTTTTSMTTTSTTTSTTMPPLENCQNGLDDDMDGNIDCKDSECMDFSCVPAVPNTWMGYFLLYKGTVAGDPGCTVDFPTEGYTGNHTLNAPPATCGACSCGSPQQQICTPPSVINGLDVSCGGTPTEIHPLFMPAGWGLCTSAQDAGGPYYYPAGITSCGINNDQPCHLAITADAPTVDGGLCSASGGAAMVTPAKWDGFGHACGGAVLTGKGCNVGQACLPKPPDPYIGGVCIKKAGVQICPAGQFSQQHVFYDPPITDTRGCSGCSCGAPAGSTCAGTISTYADSNLNSCLSPVVTFQAGGCANLAGNPAIGNSKFTVTQQPTGGSCTANPSLPTGTAFGMNPQTFCCMPDQ